MSVVVPNRFTVVERTNPTDLADEVNYLLREGWRLHGSILLVPVADGDGYKFSQAPGLAAYGTGIACVFMQALTLDVE